MTNTNAKYTEIPLKEFWDMESYTNLYCCGMLRDDNFLEMFYLVNNEEDEKEVIRACEDSGFKFKAYNLAKDATRFMWHFEKRIPKSKEQSLLSAFLGEDDKEVAPKEMWYFSYNGILYDIPMTDFILQSIVANRVQTTPETIRRHSNKLINGSARYTDTQSYQQYANHVDCAYLNEKMIDKGRPTIGLKTLVGVKGGSIMESASNKRGYSVSIYDDVVYNINDITELRDVTYPGMMETTFKIRKALLDKYPALSEHGITVNSTSAKFVEYIVSPDKAITDMPTASFIYPAKHIAEKLNVPQTDVLEDTKNWYMKNVYARVAKNNKKAADAHLIKFMSIYSFYDEIRDVNWNESASHLMMYGIPAKPKSARADLLDVYGTFLPFIDEYGNDSGTYVNFSSGGIHGAEVNMKQLKQDREAVKYLKDKYGYISMIPKGEVTPKLMNLIKAQSRSQFKDYPKHLSHEIPYMFHATHEVDEIVDPEDFTPFMYDKSTKREALIKRYKYTSVGHSVHQDFAGYYPMLLINLGTFYDGNGTDLYADVYHYRLGVKAKLKTIKYGTVEWELVNIEQEGYKLVLNSASGILDGNFDTNLRANNSAMVMRCIGQLFTFRIGMALALEGASVPSSNTDGIYVFDIDIDKNTAIVDNELKSLYVQIDPEPVYLVSKDANNRMEMEDGKVVSARGGTLTSWSGARVDNRLSHPAIVDKLMTYYLQHESVVDGPVNKDIIREHLYEYRDAPDVLDMFKGYDDAEKRTFVYMASWVMRSTSGSIMVDNENNIYPGTIRTWLATKGKTLTRYTTRKLKPSETLDDYASKLFGNVKLGDPDTLRYLTDIGAYDDHFEGAITVEDYYASRTVTEKTMTSAAGKTVTKKIYTGDSVSIIGETRISHLPDNTPCHIDNNSLLTMSEDDIDEIYNEIDMEKYVDIIADFAKTWHNPIEPSFKIKVAA